MPGATWHPPHWEWLFLQASLCLWRRSIKCWLLYHSSSMAVRAADQDLHLFSPDKISTFWIMGLISWEFWDLESKKVTSLIPELWSSLQLSSKEKGQWSSSLLHPSGAPNIISSLVPSVGIVRQLLQAACSEFDISSPLSSSPIILSVSLLFAH